MSTKRGFGSFSPTLRPDMAAALKSVTETEATPAEVARAPKSVAAIEDRQEKIAPARLSVYMPPELYERLRKTSFDRRLSMNQIIVSATEEWLNKHK